MRYFLSVLLAFAASLTLSAQVTLEDIRRNPSLSANNLCVYPADKIVDLTPVPKGFEPCYLYMFCRHGSRYHCGMDDYTKFLYVFEDAYNKGGLTKLGGSIYQRSLNLKENAEGRAGMLTKVGENQLRGIAERMFLNYPGLFVGDACINAKSTVSQRVIFTMFAFCERMKEFNPALKISRNCNSDVPGEWGSPVEKIPVEGSVWKKNQQQYLADNLDTDAFCARLFTKKYLKEADFNHYGFMNWLYMLAAIVQDIDVPFEDYQIYDAFTAQELLILSRLYNYGGQYAYYGASPETYPYMKNFAHDSMRLLVERTEDAFANGKPSATCLFCHDGNVGPISACLGIKGMRGDTMDVEEAMSFYDASRVVPMATNLQFVFFRNAEGRVIVKLLHCEREVEIPLAYAAEGAPYYDWAELKPYLLSL